MRMRTRPRSLRADLLIAALVPLIILSAGALVTNLVVARIQLGARVTAKLDTVASFLIDACELGLLTEAPEMLEEPVRRALADADIVHVAVYNPRGEMLASDGINAVPPLYADDFLDTHSAPSYRRVGSMLHELHQRVLYADEEPGREVLGFMGATPAPRERRAGKPQGYIRLVMSAERAAAEYRMLLLWSAGAMAVVLVLGAGLALALSRQSIRGISALGQAVRKIGGGDLDVRVPEIGSGEVVELSSAFNEMSAQLKAAQGEIAAHQSQLERKVEERTSELNLIRIEAERANVAKSHFLANVSHEIRTPMTAILGFVEALLQRDRDPEQQRTFLEVIRRNGTHLLDLINTILDLSKLEAGRMEIEEIEFDPADVAREVVGLLRGRAREKNLVLNLQCAPDLPASVRSDPTRLKQILFNLVGNAVKFTDDGRVLLRLRREEDEAPGRPVLCFDVIDTGIGIAQEQLTRLFEPFTQADTSHTRKFGGSGLGLTISRQIAQLMDGDISVTSEPGRGTCVRLTLPVTTPVARTAGSRAGGESPSQAEALLASLEASSPDQPVLGRVLLAEDTPDSQMLISLLITELGYAVELADNGRIAVEKAVEAWQHGEPYDLILMDIQMPELDGYGATAQLREAGYEGPIVAVTAHAMGGSRERCLQAGCDDFLTKPIDYEALTEIFQAYREKPASGDD